MTAALVLALVIVGLILAVIVQLIEKGRGILAWAVIALAVALLLPALH
jgi:hypothetical protein